MSDIRCWQCGAEPELIDVSTIGELPGSRVVPGRWPVGDHAHALRPPTPAELVDEGHRRLRRILEDDS